MLKKSMLDIVLNLQQSLLRKSISIEKSNIGQTKESSRKISSGEEIGDLFWPVDRDRLCAWLVLAS